MVKRLNMSCKKCGIKLGLMIEDENGILCVECHPTSLSNLLSPQQNLNKLEKLDIFSNLANIKFY